MKARKKDIRLYILLAMLSVGLWVAYVSVVNLGRTQRRLKELHSEVALLRKENDDLASQEYYESQDLYVEAQARDKLNLIRPGERVVDVTSPDEKNATDAAKESRVVRYEEATPQLWVLFLSGGLN